MTNEAVSNQSGVKVALKWGLILGIINTMIYIVCLSINNVNLAGIGFLIIIVACIFIIMNYRKREPDGEMSFGSAFSLCLQVFIYAGAVYAISCYVVDHYFMASAYQHIMEESMQKAQQQMVEKGQLTQDQIEMATKIRSKLMNNHISEIFAPILINVIIGAIVGLILAAILKRERPVQAQ